MISLPDTTSFRLTRASELNPSSTAFPLTAAASLSEFFSPPIAHLWLPPLTVIASLAKASARDEAPIFWIGRRIWPTPWLLGQLGLTNPSIFIDPPDHTTLLWAVDQALRTGGTRIVVADGTRMNMAATRRLQLAAESMKAGCFLARPESDLSELSAATRRWMVAPHPSDNDLPAWRMQLLRDRSTSLLAGMESPVWLIRTMRHAPQTQSQHVILNSSTCPFHLSAELVDRSAVSPLRSRRIARA